MKKLNIILLLTICFCNLQSQVWLNVIDSMPLSNHYFEDYAIDAGSNTLYLGGFFNKLNQYQTKAIIKYNGASFDTLGSGLDDHKHYISSTFVRTMVMFQNKLYIAGDFDKTGKYYCAGIGRWNGTSWDTVNFKPNGYPWYLKVYNNELYAAGGFSQIGGITTNNIAKFDGTNWHNVGYPFYTCVTAIESYKGKLFMAGQTTTASSSCANLAFYDGISWQSWAGVSGDASKTVWGMKVIDSMLYVFGRFYSIGGTNCSGLAAWDGTMWHGYGAGALPTSYATIRDVSKINGNLYASGTFDNMDGVGSYTGTAGSLTNFAKFDSLNNKWCILSGAYNNAADFSFKYNGDMYVAGAFDTIGYNKVLCLGKWNGGNSTISCGQSIGIKELGISQGIKIFPNPTSNTLHIEIENGEFENSEIEIANSLGQVVLKLPFTREINVLSLADGYYIFKIITPNKQQLHSKFIKQ
jgi:hypothetical protein